MTNNNRILVITGEAGTGKTWLIRLLQRELKLKPTATTWAAASLTDGITYYRADRGILARKDKKTKKYKPFEKEPIGRIIKKSHKVIVIDEASMLSQEKLDWMLEKWPNRKFILVGDWRQLDPVDGTAINPNDYPLIELLESQRSQDQNLGNVLSSILDGNGERFKKLISSRIMEPKFDDNHFPVRIYLQHTNAKKESNWRVKEKGSTVIGIHRLIHYNDAGIELENNEGKKIVDYVPNGIWWFNNEFCTIKNFTTEGMELERENGETRFVPGNLWKFWIDGHSLTCHKVQGQTIKKADIIIENDFIGPPEQRQRMLYVAISRATSLDQIHFREMPKIDNWVKLQEFKPFKTGKSGSQEILDCIKMFVDNVDKFLDIYIVKELSVNSKNSPSQNDIRCSLSQTKISNPASVKDQETLKDKAEKMGIKYSSLRQKIWRDKKKMANQNIDYTDIISKLKSEIIQPRGIYTDKWLGTPIKNGYVSDLSEYCTINRLIEGSKTAPDSNVACMNSFLYEFDSLSLNDQVRYAKMNLDKINRIVFSGSKSLHCRITIEDEPDNKEQYKFIHNQLNDFLFDGKADKSCSNPARLTRFPNAINEKTGREQSRLWLTETVYNWEWREKYKNEQLWILYNNTPINKQINSGDWDNSAPELLKRKISEPVRKLLTNSFADGERHSLIKSAISTLRIFGWSEDQILPYVKATGIKDYESYTKNFYNYWSK